VGNSGVTALTNGNYIIPALNYGSPDAPLIIAVPGDAGAVGSL